MAGLYLDENVSLNLVRVLEVAGHDVIVTRDALGSRSTDDALLLSSVQTGRIFITHNRHDFRLLHDAWMTWPAAFGFALPPHPAILVLDLAPWTILATVLVDFLSRTPHAGLSGAIFWWHHSDGWRQPTAGARWEPYQPSNPFGQE